MLLIIWYLALVAAGDVFAYLAGRFVEFQWGSNLSLLVFLTMYFLTLVIAWPVAVRLTEPKLTTA
jgi:CDP-diglyceride synthetase